MDLYQGTPLLGTGTGRLLARIPADTAVYANLAENRAFFPSRDHTYLTACASLTDADKFLFLAAHCAQRWQRLSVIYDWLRTAYGYTCNIYETEAFPGLISGMLFRRLQVLTLAISFSFVSYCSLSGKNRLVGNTVRCKSVRFRCCWNNVESWVSRCTGIAKRFGFRVDDYVCCWDDFGLQTLNLYATK